MDQQRNPDIEILGVCGNFYAVRNLSTNRHEIIRKEERNNYNIINQKDEKPTN